MSPNVPLDGSLFLTSGPNPAPWAWLGSMFRFKAKGFVLSLAKANPDPLIYRISSPSPESSGQGRTFGGMTMESTH